MKPMQSLLALFLSGLAIASVFAQSTNLIAKKDKRVMKHEKEYGKPNPKMPPEFSQFAFIIGKWNCNVRVKGEDGVWQPYKATWVGSYILDGYVIADEYRMTNQSGELIVHGMNFRSYNIQKKAWVMKWLNAVGSSWMELGPENLGGVRVASKTITFNFTDTFGTAVLTRVTFSNMTKNHFTWSSERSLDQGKKWTEFMVIESNRTK